jgi:GDPmannose 4,6-dehydratase
LAIILTNEEKTNNNMKTAVITGVTGQDGSYLSELLLEKGYVVYGLTRRSSISKFERIAHLLSNPNLIIKEYDLTDMVSIMNVLKSISYSTLEIYNLAAQSHVGLSFEQPENTVLIDGLGCLKFLEAIRLLNMKNVKFYQASTSELFGKVQETPQTENTPFYPRSPYGVAKLYAFWITKNYRESYNMFACNGILFNHESERRGVEFVTRKITTGISKCMKNPAHVISLGNLDSKRDWGHAKDFVYGMWLMMQQDIPSDYILSTGETHTVREFVEKAFLVMNIVIRWEGIGVNEKGYDSKTGRLLVDVNPEFYRPAEVDLLIGDHTKARSELGWSPRIKFEELVREMTLFDQI